MVATDLSATHPPEAQKPPKVGYQRQLSVEGILAQQPTLVMADESAGPPPVLEQLRSAGVPVVIIAENRTLKGAGAKIRAVAAAVGLPQEGERLATKVNREIAAGSLARRRP